MVSQLGAGMCQYLYTAPVESFLGRKRLEIQEWFWRHGKFRAFFSGSLGVYRAFYSEIRSLKF